MKHNLKSKDYRRRLSVRQEPHWQDLGDGCALGFRRGPDTWVARWHDPHSKRHLYSALRNAVEFEEAKAAAEQWWRTVSGGAVGSVQRGTVADALEAYVKALREHGRNADDIERRVTLTVAGKPFASLKVEHLSRAAVSAWRTGLLKGRAPRTVNREVRCVVAGLNWAVTHGGFAGNPLAWKLQPLADDVDAEPERAAVFLSREQREALIAAVPADAQAFLRALDHTGARPGEMAAATVADFDGARLTLRTRKGRGAKLRPRTIELTPAAVEFFAECARGKLPKAPLIAHDGAHWTRHQWAGAMRYAIQEANKKRKGPERIPVAASAYSFRHSFISEALAVLDPVTVARYCGTSVAMIERTYMRFVPGRVAAALEALRVAK